MNQDWISCHDLFSSKQQTTATKAKDYSDSWISLKLQVTGHHLLIYFLSVLVHNNNVCCNCKTKFLFQEMYLQSALLKKLRYFFPIVNQSRKQKKLHLVHGKTAVI